MYLDFTFVIIYVCVFIIFSNNRMNYTDSQKELQKEMIVNNKIYDFYQKNPHLNFEKINMDLIHILENMTFSTETIIPAYLKSCSMEILLSKCFPCNEIILTPDNNYILKRNPKTNILFASKTDFTNIDSHCTDTFIKQINETNTSGVFISQHSGIITKPDFHIDIINNHVVIYIHNCNYDIEKIKNATTLIDILTDQLKPLFQNDQEDYNIIENDLLISINAEYQASHKQVIHKLEIFTFPILDTYLSKKFINKQHKQTYTCDICKNYISYKLKGMAAHKKGCKRRLPIIL